MIQAMIFDLDGTLVQTEKLKALSYARAAVDLCPDDIGEDQVIEAFKEVVGLSRKEVAEGLIERFNLGESLRRRKKTLGVDTLWQAFVQVRLRYYEDLISDPDTLKNNQWPHNIALLEEARRTNCKTALATMSSCPQVLRVLNILDLENTFDFVASRDDVEHGKPNPEIYNLVASELSVSPQECLVIEDSPSGVKAAKAAGMEVVAVTTPFTRDALHTGNLLDARWIVDDPSTLPQVVKNLLIEHNRVNHEQRPERQQ